MVHFIFLKIHAVDCHDAQVILITVSPQAPASFHKLGRTKRPLGFSSISTVSPTVQSWSAPKKPKFVRDHLFRVVWSATARLAKVSANVPAEGSVSNGICTKDRVLRKPCYD